MARKNFPGTPMTRAIGAIVAAGKRASILGEAGTGKSSTLEKGLGGRIEQWILTDTYRLMTKRVDAVRADDAAAVKAIDAEIDALAARVPRLGAWDAHVETVVGSNREAPDFMGAMLEIDGETTYAELRWARNLNAAIRLGKRALLDLDEFNTSETPVFKAMMRVLQEGQVGEMYLDPKVAMIALGNPPERSVDAVDLHGPIANRLIHLDWSFDLDDWMNGLVSGFETIEHPAIEDFICPDPVENRIRVASRVAGYLRANPGRANPGQPADPVEAGKAWPSLRSWSNMVDVLAYVHPADEAAASLVIKGAVGDADYAAFLAYLRDKDLPDLRAAMDDPSSVDWKGLRVDQCFAVAQGVNALVVSDWSMGEEDSWFDGMAVMTEMGRANRADVALPMVRKMVEMNRQAVIDGDVPQDFVRLFGALLERMDLGFRAPRARRAATARSRAR